MTTRLLTQEFEYIAPASLHEALDLLSSDASVKILAGGTDLIVKMKTGAPVGADIIMDTGHIEELRYIAKKEEGLEIGALTKLSTAEKSEDVAPYYALADAIPLMASVAVRNMGTMGGNLGNASPASDTACPLMVYDAVVNITSPEGDRQVAVKDFFVSPGVSVLEPKEMIVSITIPTPAANSGSCFLKKARVRPDIAKISVTAYVERDGETIKACKIAMGSVAPTPILLPEAAEVAVGKKASAELFAEVAAKAADSINPIDDLRSTAEYRKDITHIMVAEALATAWTRAGGAL